MVFFFKGVAGVAVLTGWTSNLSRVAVFNLDGVLTCLAATASVNSGVLEEYDDLDVEEPLAALFDFCEAGVDAAFGGLGVFGLSVYLVYLELMNGRMLSLFLYILHNKN